MQLPKYKKKVRRKLKLCKHEDCGKEFWGHPIAKYCKFHRKPENRKRKRAKFEDVTVKNQIINHKYLTSQSAECNCALEGCRTKFSFKIYPKQFVYPKYCEEHRAEHKRSEFLRKKRITAQVC